MTGGCMFAPLSEGNSIRARACWIKAPSALTQERATPDLSHHGGCEEALPVFVSCSHLKPCLHYNVCQLAPKKCCNFQLGSRVQCSPAQQSDGKSHKTRQSRKSRKCMSWDCVVKLFRFIKNATHEKDFNISRPFIEKKKNATFLSETRVQAFERQRLRCERSRSLDQLDVWGKESRPCVCLIGGTLIGLFWTAGHDTSHEYCLWPKTNIPLALITG